MKGVILSLLMVMMLLGGTACTQKVSAEVLKSGKPRVTSPVVNQADLATLVEGNSAFAFDLYKKLRDADGNLFYSPYSISEVLSMTYGGARAETEKQMAATLQFRLPQSRLHPAFNSLDLELAKRGQGAKGKDEKGFRLHVVNALWGQQGFAFLPDYLDLLAQNYGAGIRLLDFIKATEPSRQNINQWVSEQTEEKIKDLLPPGSITTDTRLVLTNAIYFNAAWASAFKPEATIDGKFTILNGSQVNVRLMKQTESYGYASGDSYQAVELPYDGRELSMVILMPRADQFRTFETTLSGQQLSSIINSIKYQRVELSMPKFKIESKFSLKNNLSAMGMPAAFNNSDFSGIDGKTDLEIMDVVHKAYVAVDEAGTEAAAATGVIVGVTSVVPGEPVKVTIDHPFIFLIRDIKTGSILFVGRILDPTV